MLIRSNKTLEQIVTKGIELSLIEDDFSATSLMKTLGVPNQVIARVLYKQDQIRSCDLSILQQYRT